MSRQIIFFFGRCFHGKNKVFAMKTPPKEILLAGEKGRRTFETAPPFSTHTDKFHFHPYKCPLGLFFP